jgi:hypothetical protein
MAAVMGGCTMNRLPNTIAIDQAAVELSKQSKQSPQEALALAEKDIATAKKEALEYYAPIHLSLAEQYLTKAQSLWVKGGQPVEMVAETIKARKMVAEGLDVKQSVLRQLSEVFEMKVRLDQLKAEVHLHDDYMDQLDHIKKLITYIEKGDQETLDKKKKDYLSDMRALEVNVVKKITLSEPIKILGNAKKIDAKKLAPKSWKSAEDTLKQSTVYIESFPRDDAGVKKAEIGRAHV